LEKGADVNGGTNANDVTDVTPIRSAQIHGYPETAQLLLEKGARVDVYSAAGLGWKTFVRDRLKERPGLATTRDHWGSTPLWNAMSGGKAETACLLLAAGADVNECHSSLKYTGVHLAAQRNAKDLATVLLNAGADVNARDVNGKTPLWWAGAYKVPEMAAFLKVHGGTE
jgi:ankyrin repeat protein